ncbi:MAG TPA: TRIC cation channel family protein [Rhodopila sp.]|nr:TRIC cation channel family protein [Rhodopila sp.]
MASVDGLGSFVFALSGAALAIQKRFDIFGALFLAHRGMATAKVHFARIAELMGETNLRYTPEGVYVNNQHITGTMGMGDDPKASATDKFGRARDLPNLFTRKPADKLRCRRDLIGEASIRSLKPSGDRNARETTVRDIKAMRPSAATRRWPLSP